jgi:integrase
VRGDGGAQWVLRVTAHGRRRAMGLGGYPEIGLADARKLAERWRKMAAEGRDPVKEREKEERAARREDISLAVVTADALEARKAELRGDGAAGRWLSPLNLHVLPKLGRVPVTDIDQRDIRDTLAPIWHTKADTTRKAMNRLSIVLKHAAALGLDVDLQAADKAKALLGKSRHQPKNIPAMNWRDVPAEAMKGRKCATEAFRVPLSTEAQRVIDLAYPNTRNGFLFPNNRQGVISYHVPEGSMAVS